jgi:phosphoribosylaminoimidazolecarboxamide formyltransferase/IMP cyclohydrolase
MPRALLSVHDKTHLTKFAATLIELGWNLVASDGTEKALKSAGIEATPVEQITAMPEMLGGRVKTLHPAIHSGILATDRPEDLDELSQAGYAPINMVVCNLRPFQELVARGGVTLQDAVEQIDVGGVTLLRAAARNFFHVIVVCDTNDYGRIGAALKAGGSIDLQMRRDLAIKAFAHTRDYDTAIHAFLSQDMVSSLTSAALPEQLSFGMRRVATLEHGENVHQTAAYYSRRGMQTPLGARVVAGKALTYTNVLDLNGGWRAAIRFEEPIVIVMKCGTPTGIASGDDIASAYLKAFASDPVAAVGGTIVTNRPVDMAFVEALGTTLIDMIAAPSFNASALEALSSQRKTCRLVEIPQVYTDVELDIRSVYGGLLIQSADTGDPDGTTLKAVTQRTPSSNELAALQFAWKAVQHARSRAIVVAVADATVGIGGGLPNCADSARLATAKAGERAQGAVMASDSFLPTTEIVEIAAQTGISAIIQPGGSIRDSEIIAAANAANIAMVFTGTRHLKH